MSTHPGQIKQSSWRTSHSSVHHPRPRHFNVWSSLSIIAPRAQQEENIMTTLIMKSSSFPFILATRKLEFSYSNSLVLGSLLVNSPLSPHVQMLLLLYYFFHIHKVPPNLYPIINLPQTRSKILAHTHTSTHACKYTCGIYTFSCQPYFFPSSRSLIALNMFYSG